MRTKKILRICHKKLNFATNFSISNLILATNF